MPGRDDDLTTTVLRLLADELADRVVSRVAERLPAVSPNATPWLTTAEAISYSRLPEGTFRKLMTSGKIPSHGGRAKLFYRPEIDQALLDFSGIAEDNRQLRRVR
jgi:hypothetical protein